MLSLVYKLRYSQIRAYIPGITNRSLSLKLDELERMGILTRTVTQDKPPHVDYELTEHGHTLARLTFPLLLHLSMPNGLANRLSATTSTPPAPAPPEELV
jgi:DNA-binding HxlR family transcriptional regulator